MRHGSGHISVLINHSIAAQYRCRVQKGDSFLEVMEHKCWKRSSQVQTDTLILCWDRCILSNVHRPFWESELSLSLFWLAVPNTTRFTILHEDCDTSFPTVTDM